MLINITFVTGKYPSNEKLKPCRCNGHTVSWINIIKF